LTLLPLQDKQRMLQQMAAPDNLTPMPANGPFLLESSGLAREPDGEAVGGPMTAGQPYPNDANPELAVNRGQDKSPKSDHPRRTRNSSRVPLCPGDGQGARMDVL